MSRARTHILISAANRRLAWLAMAMAPLVLDHGAAAAPPKSDAPPPSSIANRGSAIGHVTNRIAVDLGAGAKEAWVFVGPLRSDENAPRGDELVGKVATLLAGAFGGIPHVEAVAPSTAHALAHHAKALVYAQIEISGGQLRVSADLYRTTPNVWDRARQPAPLPASHVFAAARVDAEVRTFLAPIPLSQGHVDHVATDDRDIVALACGDVDDDGSLEIVTLGRRRAAIGRARGGRFVATRTALLRDLSGIAAAPLREPIGGIAIVPRRADHVTYIDIGITDRAHGSRLDADLRPIGTISGVPFAVGQGDACVTFNGTSLSGAWSKCADTDAALLPVADAPFDAAAFGPFVTADGNLRTVTAVRDPRTSELHISSESSTATLAPAGAQVAIADLDQDGAPEIVSTMDVLPKPTANGPPDAVDDAVVITTWLADGTLRERARTPVPGGVRAVAVCPPDRAGAAPVILATTAELWILR
jgi:hypothetical protein